MTIILMTISVIYVRLYVGLEPNVIRLLYEYSGMVLLAA